MGSAKVVFVSGFCIILGIYSYGFRNTDSKLQNIGAIHSYEVQADEIAKSGIAHAINALGAAKPHALPSLNTKSLFSGTLAYSCDDVGLAIDQVRITSTGKFQGQQITRVAIVKLVATTALVGKKKKKWNQWVTEKVFFSKSANEFSSAY
ncbi:MAG: hypothetical protein ACRDGA_02755 [Bacteroidota bacterium]